MYHKDFTYPGEGRGVLHDVLHRHHRHPLARQHQPQHRERVQRRVEHVVATGAAGAVGVAVVAVVAAVVVAGNNSK